MHSARLRWGLVDWAPKRCAWRHGACRASHPATFRKAPAQPAWCSTLARHPWPTFFKNDAAEHTVHLTSQYGRVTTLDAVSLLSTPFPFRCRPVRSSVSSAQRCREVHHHPDAAGSGPPHGGARPGVRHRRSVRRPGAPAAGVRALRRGVVILSHGGIMAAAANPPNMTARGQAVSAWSTASRW